MAQTPAEADLRGNDAPGERDRAVAFAQAQANLAKNRLRLLNMLKGNQNRRRDLEHKTLPLTTYGPPYTDAP